MSVRALVRACSCACVRACVLLCVRACVRRTLAQLALQPLLCGAFLLRTLLLLAPCLAHVAQDDPVAVLAIPGVGINVRGVASRDVYGRMSICVLPGWRPWMHICVLFFEVLAVE